MTGSQSHVLDRKLRALSDETRRRIWRLLGERPGSSTADLTGALPHLSRWAVMKHLNVLRDADLVQTLPRGRQRCHYRVERGLEDVRTWLLGSGETGDQR